MRWKASSMGLTRSSRWSSTSTPAQKALPPAANSTALRPDSPAAHVRAAATSSIIAMFRILSGGRVRTIRATPPASTQRRNR